jgi:hypothetical protein
MMMPPVWRANFLQRPPSLSDAPPPPLDGGGGRRRRGGEEAGLWHNDDEGRGGLMMMMEEEEEEGEAPADAGALLVSTTESFRFVMCVMHTLLLIAAVALVASRKTTTVDGGWTVSPADAGCLAWLDGECVRVSTDAEWTRLADVGRVVPRRALGLFSEMNVAVTCLVAQSVTAALAMALLPPVLEYDEDNRVRLLFQKAGGCVLILCGGLLLVMQARWHIPANNLLWLEAVLVATYATSDHHVSYHAMLSTTIALPMLGVAALAAAGEDNVCALVSAYAGLCLVGLICVLDARMDDAFDEAAMECRAALRWSAWLCLTPFACRAGLRVLNKKSAALAVALVWAVGVVLVFSIALLLDQTRHARRRDKYAVEVRCPSFPIVLMQHGLHVALMLLLLLSVSQTGLA